MFSIGRISGLLPQIIGKDRPPGPNGGGRGTFGQHCSQTELPFEHADRGLDSTAKPLEVSKPFRVLMGCLAGRQPTDLRDAYSTHPEASKLDQVLRAVKSSICGNLIGNFSQNLFGLANQGK